MYMHMDVCVMLNIVEAGRWST